MLTIGRVCVKTAGRDAGQMAVIVDVLDNNLVMIDGQVRRRKCNVMHLEPTSKTVDVSKNASHGDVVKALKAVDIAVVERKPKAKAAKQTVKKLPMKYAPTKKAKKPAVAKTAAVKTAKATAKVEAKPAAKK